MSAVGTADATAADTETGPLTTPGGGNEGSQAPGQMVGNGVFIPDDPEVQGLLKPVPMMTAMEWVAGAIALAAVGTSLWAMIIVDKTISILAGVFSAVTGCYGYYQQNQITEINILKETQEKVKNAGEKLKSENDRLLKNVNEMEDQLTKLQEIESTFQTLNSLQGSTIEEFASQVEQSKQTLLGQKQVLAGLIANNLLGVVAKCDKDRDQIFDKDEVDEMIAQVRNISGVTIDEDKFRATVSDQPMASVWMLISNLNKYSELTPDERIFTLDEEIFLSQRSRSIKF